jgi:hypothetical protein
VKASLVLAEKLIAGGKRDEARRIYSHLKETRKGPEEAYIREAAERGLQRAAAVTA